MKNLLGIIKLLKRFGIYTYTGNRRDDIGLIQSEVKDLYNSGLLSQEDYLTAIMICRNELSKMD